MFQKIIKIAFSFLFVLDAIFLEAKTYFVSTNGNDSYSGESTDAPFKTITKALSVVFPGDFIYVRGGIHNYSSTITISKSGVVTDTCHLFAYPGERPVLNFSATTSGKKGISITGSFWYIKGFDVVLAGDNGLNISGGGNNLVEFCSFSENKDSGVQLGGGAHDNTFINCDSYFNADPPDYGDADGFSPKLDVGSNNKFIGCRSWGNCDDGWDGYMRGATNVTTILENCWTWGNGYLKNGTDPGPQANGNGFKMGGGDNSNSLKLMHHFYLTNCVAFYNKVKGFDQNNNVGTMSMLNCSGYKNKEANYRIKSVLVAGQTLTLKNCISYDGIVDLGSFAIQATNSWISPFIVTSGDFITLDTTGVSAPRKADGSLPDVNFMHLAPGSDLIDVGTNVGLKYYGSAPDLGAFETIPTGSSEFLEGQGGLYISGNSLRIRFTGSEKNLANCRIFNIAGQKVFETRFNSASETIILPSFKRGIYMVETTVGEKRWVKKFVL